MPIDPELLEILGDPAEADRPPLKLSTREGQEYLVNEKTGRHYPIKEGIPVLLVEESIIFEDASKTSPSA